MSRGRHRGKFRLGIPWPRGIRTHGFHRGEYVEKPEWKTPRPKLTRTRWYGNWGIVDDGSLRFMGTITLPSAAPIESGVAVVVTPNDGAANLPALIEDPEAREEEIRHVVQGELASTPIYSGLRFGRFGDSHFDIAEPAPVCPPVADESAGGGG